MHTHTVSLSLHYIQKSSNGVDRIAVGAPGTYLWRGTYIRIHLYTYVAIYIHCGLYTCLYLVLVANDYRCFDSDHTHRLRISTIPTLWSHWGKHIWLARLQLNKRVFSQYEFWRYIQHCNAHMCSLFVCVFVSVVWMFWYPHLSLSLSDRFCYFCPKIRQLLWSCKYTWTLKMKVPSL